jgi:quercetin dioxygenase-like cupin family protein
MHRQIRRLWACALLVAALAAGTAAAIAQDDSPATAEPITVQALGAGLPSDAPGKQLLLLRVTILPGAGFPAHVHPGALVIVVESGEFGFTVLEGEADYTPAAVDGTTAATEQLAVGEEIVAHAGDQIFEQAGVIHTAHNVGDSPAVVLVAGLVDPTQPFLQPMDMEMGTPAT